MTFTSGRDNDMVLVRISDSGEGISPEIIDKIFQPFYSTKPKGSGLGLTLVKEIVEAHRGRVLVESEPGKGSVFSIRLPLPQMKGDLP